MQAFKQWIKKHFGHLVYASRIRPAAKERLLEKINALPARLPVLSAASADIFTYHGEDGIIACLLGRLGNVPEIFVDIGSGDCIKSNCAMLAVHFGWNGVFIDQNNKQLAVGRQFYRKLVNKAGSISFKQASVGPDNINQLLKGAGLEGSIGLLSIDIDGNDYWVWEAVEVIRPKIVVIEAKVEFGTENVIVPYGPENHRDINIMCNGASVVALARLGKKKGYKLAGANKQGYNLFFVLDSEAINEATPDEILSDKEIQESFYPASFFNEHKFISR